MFLENGGENDLGGPYGMNGGGIKTTCRL